MIPVTRLIVFFFSCGLAQFILADALVEQTFTLQPGWNAIHLEVDPNDGDEQTQNDRKPSTVFSLPQISMVWVHPYASTTAQYIQSPSAAGFNEAGWRLYLPETTEGENGTEGKGVLLTNLYAVTPGQVYLVKVDGSEQLTLTVRGKPTFKPIQWQPMQFNLVGFFVDPEQAVSFANLLGLSATQNPSIYALDENNTWTLVNQGKHALVESGRGYWIYNDGSITQSGPLEISPVIRNGLHFREQNLTNQLAVTNRSASATTVSFQVGDQFPLRYFAGYGANGDESTPQWLALESLTPNVASDGQFSTMVSVDQSALAASGNESVLTIRAAGMRIRLPVSAVPMQERTGLWAGIAVLREVTNVHSESQGLELTPAPLQIKLLLHVDDNGQARLLKQVYFMEHSVASENGEGLSFEAVLVTNDACLASYQPLNLTNREGVGNRLSSSAFDFASSSLPLSGSLTEAGTLSAELHLDADLPTHPMKHRYHVGHDDNDNASGEAIIGDESTSPFYDEVWDITRQISLNPDQYLSPSPDAGFGQMTGVYAEIISGIHKNPITAQGRFLLHRISPIANLVEDDCLP